MQTPIQVSLARVDREEFINAGVILFSKPELGPKDFAQLKELLCRVWESPLIR
jgi:hypothetical protein